MPDRPSLFVDWDTNQTDVTNPSGPETTDGYAQNALPTRQVLNRLFNLKGSWIRWFDQVAQRATDAFANNQILYASTTLPAQFSSSLNAPVIWSGTHSTTLSAAYFSGAAIINHYRHGPIDSPAVVINGTSRDYYVDLGQDGVWDFNDVAHLGMAPALAANHVRFFMLVTNAGGTLITDGTFFGDGRRFLAQSIPQRMAQGAIISGAVGMAFDQATVPGTSVILHDAVIMGGSDTDQDVTNAVNEAGKELLAGNSTTVPAGLAGNDSHWWAHTVNCRRTGTWANQDAGSDSYLFVMHEAGLSILRHAFGDGTTWANTIAAGTWAVVATISHNGQVLSGSLSVGFDLTVGNNLDVAADAAVVGNLGAGALFTDVHSYVTPQTFRRWFAAIDGSFDPTMSSVGNGFLDGNYLKNQAGAGDVVIQLDLPNGALITGARASVSTNGASWRAELRRYVRTGAPASVSLHSGGFTGLADQGSLSNLTVTALNAVDQNNTIDNATYSYICVIRNNTGADTAAVAGVDVTFSMSAVRL